MLMLLIMMAIMLSMIVNMTMDNDDGYDKYGNDRHDYVRRRRK